MAGESTRFKKGNKASKGKPRLEKVDRDARKFNKIELERVLNKYLYTKKSQLEEMIKNEDLPMIDMCVIRLLVATAAKGDHKRLEFIFDRLVGKVTTPIEVQNDPWSALREAIKE